MVGEVRRFERFYKEPEGLFCLSGIIFNIIIISIIIDGYSVWRGLLFTLTFCWILMINFNFDFEINYTTEIFNIVPIYTFC